MLLRGADRDRLVALVSHNYLSPIRVSPFLVAALLSHSNKAVLAQDANYILRIAGREAGGPSDGDFDQFGGFW